MIRVLVEQETGTEVLHHVHGHASECPADDCHPEQRDCTSGNEPSESRQKDDCDQTNRVDVRLACDSSVHHAQRPGDRDRHDGPDPRKTEDRLSAKRRDDDGQQTEYSEDGLALLVGFVRRLTRCESGRDIRRLPEQVRKPDRREGRNGQNRDGTPGDPVLGGGLGNRWLDDKHRAERAEDHADADARSNNDADAVEQGIDCEAESLTEAQIGDERMATLLEGDLRGDRQEARDASRDTEESKRSLGVLFIAGACERARDDCAGSPTWEVVLDHLLARRCADHGGDEAHGCEHDDQHQHGRIPVGIQHAHRCERADREAHRAPCRGHGLTEVERLDGCVPLAQSMEEDDGHDDRDDASTIPPPREECGVDVDDRESGRQHPEDEPFCARETRPEC